MRPFGYKLSEAASLVEAVHTLPSKYSSGIQKNKIKRGSEAAKA